MLVALVAVLCAVLAIETIQLYFIIDGQSAIGTDLDYYRFVAERFVTTGVYYTDQQLAGPYVVQTQVHNLYPPHALYLFVPFLYLPDILWWVVPLAFLAYVIWWCRPTPWVWPVLLFLLALPKGPAQFLFGNTDMWIAAFVAGAVRWAWPGVLVSIKPSLVLCSASRACCRVALVARGGGAGPRQPPARGRTGSQYPVHHARTRARTVVLVSAIFPFFVVPIAARGWARRAAGDMPVTPMVPGACSGRRTDPDQS